MELTRHLLSSSLHLSLESISSSVLSNVVDSEGSEEETLDAEHGEADAWKEGRGREERRGGEGSASCKAGRARKGGAKGREGKRRLTESGFVKRGFSSEEGLRTDD